MKCDNILNSIVGEREQIILTGAGGKYCLGNFEGRDLFLESFTLFSALAM